MPSIFSRIIRREIPCHEIYRDDRVIAFLDIAPVSKGHAIVVPTEEGDFLHQLSDESAAAVGRVLPRVARAILAATGATSYNILQNNGKPAHQAVPHVHFHVIPKHADGSGLGIQWNAGQLSSHEGATLASMIREQVGR